MAKRIDRGRGAGRAERAERLAATLRANLRKRKEQSLARAQSEAPGRGSAHDSAGIAADKADRPR
jgi:hypothetical protein